MSNLFKHKIYFEITIYLPNRAEVLRTDRKEVTDSGLHHIEHNLTQGNIPDYLKVNNSQIYIGKDLLKNSIVRMFVEPNEDEDEDEESDCDMPPTDFYGQDEDDLSSFYEDLSDIEDMDTGRGLLVDDEEADEIYFKD